MGKNGCERSLIVKNCTKRDYGKYTVKYWPYKNYSQKTVLNKTGSSISSTFSNYIKNSFCSDETYENGIGRFTVVLPFQNTPTQWLQNGKVIDPKRHSILKFEQILNGCERTLIVKNCKKNDFTTYTFKCGGTEYHAKLLKVTRDNYFRSRSGGIKNTMAAYEANITFTTFEQTLPGKTNMKKYPPMKAKYFKNNRLGYKPIHISLPDNFCPEAMFFQVNTDLPFKKLDTWTMTSLMIDEPRMNYLKPGIGSNAQHIKTNNNYLYFVGGGENIFLLNLIPEYRDSPSEVNVNIKIWSRKPFSIDYERETFCY